MPTPDDNEAAPAKPIMDLETHDFWVHILSDHGGMIPSQAAIAVRRLVEEGWMPPKPYG